MSAPIVYTYNAAGVSTGSRPANPVPSKLQPGEFLLPAQATFIATPTVPAGQQAVFSTANQAWSLQPILAPPGPVPNS